MAETTTIAAINRTLADAMRADERVIVLGEDVAEGGPYTATAGLAEEFGVERVINTPISEAAITGVAIGAAQAGLRPVLEIMFVDFLTLALDQLVNAAAKAHFMSGGQLTVPLVVRTQAARASRRGAALAESRELAHARPGREGRHAKLRRRRGRPARERDRRSEPGRVRRVQDALLPPGGDARRPVPVPIGDAAVLREGRDVTVVAVSRLVHEALAAAERLAAEDGIEVEVIDPRTLVPLDLATIVGSVERTGALVVAHEAVLHGGFGAGRRTRAGGRVRVPRCPDRARRCALYARAVQRAARGRLPAGRRRDRRRGARAEMIRPASGPAPCIPLRPEGAHP